MAVQHVRRSQFITTFGPGSIVEGRSGPRVILMPDRGLFGHLNLHPSDLEIRDRRLQTVCSGRVYRLPSNVELGRSDSQPIYRTAQFPTWKHCVDHHTLYMRRCPTCGQGGHAQAVRFIIACDHGHMDDVDWLGAVHRYRSRCNSDHLEWLGGGGTLRETQIRCPRCQSQRDLGSIYYDRNLRCSGRFPEREAAGPRRTACSREGKVTHRGALNLRIPEPVCVLLVPPLSTNLHRLLQGAAVQDALRGAWASNQTVPDKAQIERILRSLCNDKRISTAMVDEILSYPDTELAQATRDVLEYKPPENSSEMMDEEFQALRRAAEHGAPPTPTAPGLLHHFEVSKNQVRELTGPGGMRLRVAPVGRLIVIMIQTGYRRLDPVQGQMVSIAHADAGTNWLPGVELRGEGIYLETVEPFVPQGRAATRWAAIRDQSAGDYPSHLFLQPVGPRPRELDPVFVWWHSLSHRLITALGVDSGFSSTSIRERIYFSREPNGRTRGGLLLYSVQPGGDGTHGGLIALANSFERVLDSALRDVDVCSNDPFCRGNVVAPGSYAGAACYACQLVSETSCDHRNMWLDRQLLLENKP